MVVIEKREKTKKIPQNFRLRPEIVAKVEKIARELVESKTYVIESLLEYGIRAYEKEKKR
jgi:predicted transcriptional regulator